MIVKTKCLDPKNPIVADAMCYNRLVDEDLVEHRKSVIWGLGCRNQMTFGGKPETSRVVNLVRFNGV